MRNITDRVTHHHTLEIIGNPRELGNGVKIAPADASSAPVISAVGDDTNIDLTLTPKGTGAIKSASAILSTGPTKGVGYATGAGGAVTQITNSATGVTLSKVTGQITTVALTTAAAAEERFTVTNTNVAATDVIALSTTYNGAGTPIMGVVNVAAGAFDIVITNLHAANALNAVMVINFAVIKGVAA